MKVCKRDWIAMAALLMVVGIYSYHRWIRPSLFTISSTGGASMSVDNWPVEPFYLQNDSRWGNETMGGSGEQISDVGCTLCCISMAFTHLGTAVTPKEFNDYLKNHDGYNKKGWLNWGAAAGFSDGKIAIEIPRLPSYEKIDAAIRTRQFVIVKILLPGNVPHWVLIVGKEGVEYLVKNPLNDQMTLEKLSVLSPRIEAIRIVKAVTAS